MWMFCKSCQDSDWLLFQLEAVGLFVVVAGLWRIGAILLEEFKKGEKK